jgi:hypothetical protein
MEVDDVKKRGQNDQGTRRPGDEMTGYEMTRGRNDRDEMTASYVSLGVGRQLHWSRKEQQTKPDKTRSLSPLQPMSIQSLKEERKWILFP